MPYLFPEGAQFGADHVILNARSRRHRVEAFAGPFSIKTVVQGKVSWTVGGRDLVLDPSSFLVLTAGEVYSMNIDEPRPVETACVFFRDGFVEHVAHDLASEFTETDMSRRTLPWVTRLHSGQQGSIVSHVQTMARRCRERLMPSGFEEDLLLLARDLLLLYDEMHVRIRRVRAEKASTRSELFRRVETGREYMHAGVEARLSLEDVSRAACLSRYHFHRAFVQVWGKTPHQYLTAIRLGRARSLLESGMPVADVARAIGFASDSSFSRQFRSAFGTSPGTSRKIRKIGHSQNRLETVPSGS